MPELPEVQALVTMLDTELRGAVVDKVTMRSVAALKTFDPQIDSLHGQTVQGCRRAGKFICLDIEPSVHFVVHVARAGWLHLREHPTNARPSLRGPLVFVMSLRDGRALEGTEQGTEKRFAVYLVRELEQVPGIARLGIDALDAALDVARLGDMLSAQPGTLKSVLADQAVIAGIGNAYSDEILHAAKLSPFRKASTLDPIETQRLHAALRGVLEEAMARARSVDTESLRDEKKLRMNVHGRAGKACPVCGDTVREVSFSSRSFQYCPTCQTGGKVYADRRLSKLLR